MTLKISLIHFAVKYKQNRANRSNLLDLIHKAAGRGADLILGPEMALSGYGFNNRREIADHVEDEGCVFLKEVTEIAARFNCHIAVGLALADPKTDIFYNSLVVTGPAGTVCRYRKINAESRWACPGDPCQNNIFTTRWGKIGVLICSDTYHGLIPRVTALKGAGLLLVAANWPPSGLDPVELWQARARENGIPIAVCNRTGRDREMDCRTAESCLIDAKGRIVTRHSSPDSTIVETEIPLNENHRLEIRIRNQRLETRKPALYHDCYRNLAAISNLSSYFALPPAGKIRLECLTGATIEHCLDRLAGIAPAKSREDIPGLLLLPALDYHPDQIRELERCARRQRSWLIVGRVGKHLRWSLFHTDGQSRHWSLPATTGDQKDLSYPMFDLGPLRIALTSLAELNHPEYALALAKQGCDLIIASESEYGKDKTRLMAGTATINHLAVAVCGRDGAGIWIHADGHQRWHEALAQPDKSCTAVLDSAPLRKKRFQERIDFDHLFCDFAVSK